MSLVITFFWYSKKVNFPLVNSQFFFMFIDLTQIQNQSILVTPPPVQFSDNFKQNECNKHDKKMEFNPKSFKLTFFLN